jgi:hypothetical protein
MSEDPLWYRNYPEFIALYETRKRETIGVEILDRFRGVADAGMIIGSTAYGWEYSVRNDSDLDLLLVIDPLRVATIPDDLVSANQRPPQQLLDDGLVDIWEFLHSGMNFPVNCYVWTPDFLHRMTRDLKLEYANRFSRRLAGGVSIQSFHGESKRHNYKPRLLEDGMVLDFPVHLFYDDHYFAGVPAENMLSFPAVQFSTPELELDASIQSLHSAVIEQAATEGAADYSSIILRRNRFSPGSELNLNYRQLRFALRTKFEYPSVR